MWSTENNNIYINIYKITFFSHKYIMYLEDIFYFILHLSKYTRSCYIFVYNIYNYLYTSLTPIYTQEIKLLLYIYLLLLYSRVYCVKFCIYRKFFTLNIYKYTIFVMYFIINIYNTIQYKNRNHLIIFRIHNIHI